jgi:hypothetical protein
MNFIKHFSIILILATLISCSKKVSKQSLQGEWLAENVSFYMSIQNDKISYFRSNWSSNTFCDQHIGMPTGSVTFNILNDCTLIAYGWPHDTLGKIYFDKNNLCLNYFVRYEGFGNSKPFGRKITLPLEKKLTHLQKLNADSSIKVERIQFSSFWLEGRLDWYDPQFERMMWYNDIELRPESVIISDDGKFYPYSHEATFSKDAFKSCERIIQQAFSNKTISDTAYVVISKQIKGTRRDSVLSTDNRIVSSVLTLFINGKRLSLMCPFGELPPELTPLTRYFMWEGINFKKIHRIKKYAVYSRLPLQKTFYDSIRYLALFDSINYRPANPKVGLRKFYNDVAKIFIGTLKYHYPIDIYVDEKGLITKIRAENKDSESSSKLFKILKILKPTYKWDYAIYKGKAIPWVEQIDYQPFLKFKNW